MSLPYACLGHWYVQIAFAGPSLLIFGAMGRDKVRRYMRARKGLEPLPPRSKQKPKAAQAKRA